MAGYVSITVSINTFGHGESQAAFVRFSTRMIKPAIITCMVHLLAKKRIPFAKKTASGANNNIEGR